MKRRILVAILALNGAMLFGETKPPAGVDVHMILTVADHMNHQPAALKPDALKVMDATVTAVTALESGRDLEVFLLIDDAANYDFTLKLAELRQFVTTQPASVPVGVAYIHDGALQVAENPTLDRAAVAQALRVPSGSQAANPYCAVSDLIQGWKKGPARREIVLVSTGIDDSASEGAVCVNAEMAIRDAQRAGVLVYALYNPMKNFQAANWTKVDSGVTGLAHVCYETGGESYFLGHNPMESIAPYLADIAEHLANQYLVTLRLAAVPASGYQTIFLSTEEIGREFMKPDKVWVAVNPR